MRALARSFVIILVAAIAARVVHVRSQVVREGYQMRALLDDRARLGNELLWLEAQVAGLEQPERLLTAARRFDLEVGTREANVRVIPVSQRGGVE